jgi:hypothetical protein
MHSETALKTRAFQVMKRLLTAFLLVASIVSAWSVTTIDPGNKYAYGANIGWIDWRGDTNNGAVVGEYVCSGYIYAANVGWIQLGGGAPTNGIYYQNVSANDFGVNQDGFGNLRGLAYGANIGWINFTNGTAAGLLAFADQPRVDLKTGKFSGYVYSANCGWINLSNAFALVQTDTIAPGADTDADGLPDAWERLNFVSLAATPGADPDGDGMSNLQEYLAGTDPNSAGSNLRITAIAAAIPGTKVNLTWTSVSNRCYFVQEELNLTVPGWFDSGLGTVFPDSGVTTTRLVSNTNAPVRFYRVQAFRPLGP